MKQFIPRKYKDYNDTWIDLSYINKMYKKSWPEITIVAFMAAYLKRKKSMCSINKT